MKTLKLFVIAILLAITCSASAQFVNSKSTGVSQKESAYREPFASLNSDVDNYGLLTFSPVFSIPYIHNVSGDTFYGIGIGYLWGINITGHKLPLFVELGPDVNYMVRKDDAEYEYYDDSWYHLLSVNTPLNVAYKLKVGDNITLAPFVGLTARINILAMSVDDEETYNAFDDGNAKRFQLGFNAGVGAYFNRFYVGYRYNHDITALEKSDYSSTLDVTLDHHYITLGIKF